MGRIGLAFKVFFDVLFNAARADQIRKIEAAPPPESSAEAEPASAPVVEAKPTPPPAKPTRSDALTLLETLQREARLIDFLQEEISSYNDQQVGAAVREIHRGCRDVLQRMFVISPVLQQDEGSSFTVSESEDAARIRLVGKVVERRPVTGTLVHAGWRAEKCDLPQWGGAEEAKLILAPAEVELT